MTDLYVTTEVIAVLTDGGAATCHKCGGDLMLSYVVICSNEKSYSYCSLCVPSAGEFIRVQ